MQIKTSILLITKTYMETLFGLLWKQQHPSKYTQEKKTCWIKIYRCKLWLYYIIIFFQLLITVSSAATPAAPVIFVPSWRTAMSSAIVPIWIVVTISVPMAPTMAIVVRVITKNMYHYETHTSSHTMSSNKDLCHVHTKFTNFKLQYDKPYKIHLQRITKPYKHAMCLIKTIKYN